MGNKPSCEIFICVSILLGNLYYTFHYVSHLILMHQLPRKTSFIPHIKPFSADYILYCALCLTSMKSPSLTAKAFLVTFSLQNLSFLALLLSVYGISCLQTKSDLVLFFQSYRLVRTAFVFVK